MVKTHKSVADIRKLFVPLMGACSEELRAAFEQLCAMADVHEKSRKIMDALQAALRTAFSEAQAQLGGKEKAATPAASTSADDASKNGVKAAQPKKRRTRRQQSRHATPQETAALIDKVLKTFTAGVAQHRASLIAQVSLSADETRRLAYVLRLLRKQDRVRMVGTKGNATYQLVN